MKNTFVGRENPLNEILSFLKTTDQGKSLQLLSISGPGGIGKTCLLNQGLKRFDFIKDGYLKLAISGASANKRFHEIICYDLISRSVGVDLESVAYKTIKKCREEINEIEIQNNKLLENAELNSDLKHSIKKALPFVKSGVELIPHAKHLVRILRPTKSNSKELSEKDLKEKETKLNIKEKAKELEERERKLEGDTVDAIDPNEIFTDENVDKAFDFLDSLRGYRESEWNIFGNASLRNQIRDNICRTLAEMLTADIDYIFQTQVGIKELLLIIDDYEGLQPKLENFLTENFLPLLKKANFNSKIIIIGRDRLGDTNPAWDQTYGDCYNGNIPLNPFDHDEARDFILQSGIENEKEINRIISDTEGYPYLLVNEVEDYLNGGRNALNLKKFFDRTTRWMSSEQKEWMIPVSFMNEINLESLEHMFPGHEPQKILEWFKSEASIRSNSSSRWKVMPIISSKIKAYVRNDSPKLYKHLEHLSKEAHEIAGSVN